MDGKLYDACKLCNSKQLSFVYVSRRLGLPIMRCSMCGLFFVGKVFSAEEQQALYDQYENYRVFAEAERSVPQMRARHLGWLDQIQRQLDSTHSIYAKKQGLRLLDIGCGAGDFLVAARDRGFEIYGLEVSIPAAQLANEWNGLQVETRDLADDPRAGFFDVVTAIGLLEHVINPAVMLHHIKRLLAPGGLLFIYTPIWGTYDTLTSFVARVSDGRFTRPIDRRINQLHLQIFPKATLTNLLREFGLETLTCEVVCEYNLPVEKYLRSLGITWTRLQSLMGKSIQALIDRRLFFRNNMCVIARKL